MRNCRSGWLEAILEKSGEQLSKAEISRADAHAWLVAILESTSDAIVGAALDGRIRSVNASACHVFGYSPAEFLELTIGDIIVPERADVLEQNLTRLRRGERLPSSRTVLTRSGGERFPASVTPSPILGEDGDDVIGYSAVIRDLSTDKNAEETRRLLEALIRSSPDAIYSRTLRGVITSWNPGAEALFGYEDQEILGRSLRMLIPKEGEAELGEFTRRIQQGEEVRDYDTIRLTKDQQRIPVSLTLFPIRDEAGAVTEIGCFARDLMRSVELQRSFDKLQRLSPREREVMGLISDGLSNREIADELGLSEQTVKNYVSRVLLKLNMTTRAHAAAAFLSFRAFLGSSREAS